MTTITLNAKKNTLEVTKKFATAAAKFGTDEYKQLQEVRRDYPTYKVVTISRKAPKPQYKGLTFSYMESYIEAHDDEEKSIMAHYMMLRAKDEESQAVNAESFSYLEIKEWFLKTFPAIRDYHEKRSKLLATAAKAM